MMHSLSILILPILFLLQIFSPNRVHLETVGLTPEPKLSIILNPHQVPVRIDDDLELNYTIVNLSSEPLTLYYDNGVDYKGSLDQNVYCVVRKNGLPYTKWKEWMVYGRMRTPTLDDVFTIQQNETTTFSFDFQSYYHIDRPGNYKVRVVYAPDPIFDVGIRKHKPVYSNWIELKIVD